MPWIRTCYRGSTSHPTRLGSDPRGGARTVQHVGPTVTPCNPRLRVATRHTRDTRDTRNVASPTHSSVGQGTAREHPHATPCVQRRCAHVQALASQRPSGEKRTQDTAFLCVPISNFIRYFGRRAAMASNPTVAAAEPAPAPAPAPVAAVASVLVAPAAGVDASLDMLESSTGKPRKAELRLACGVRAECCLVIAYT